MWIAENLTPFVLERTFLRDRRGGTVWVVAVRATFDILPDGTVRRAAEQVPVSRVATYLGEPGRSTLHYDSDLILGKPGVDLILHGQAHPPGGRAVPTLDVGIRLGSWTKAVRVHGERVWQMGAAGTGLVATRPRPFTEMALVYERAWGGLDPATEKLPQPLAARENPLGCGYSKTPNALIGKPAPNLEDPRRPAGAGPGPFPVAGFAPIAPHWAPRVTYAGTYDEAWKRDRAPLLPKDFDDRFHRIAPADQQLPPFAADGQLIELINLSPAGKLRFALPNIRIGATTVFRDREVAHEAALHTVILEPEHPRLQLVWHTALPCQGRDHLLVRSRIDWEGDLSCLGTRRTSTG
jgi:hypothetical protein